jgi:hypothetical protein
LFNCGLLIDCSPVQAFDKRDSNPKEVWGKNFPRSSG